MSKILVPDNQVSKAVKKDYSWEQHQKEQKIPNVIPQTERLFTTRSRAVHDKTGRGSKAFIRVLTANPELSKARTSEGNDAKPTSIVNGKSTALEDAVSGAGYASFLLTDVRCNLDEKLQVVETFGDSEVSYYFGRQPIMFEFSGVLIDSVDNNWFVEWLEMYSTVMRGTQLARNYELLQIVLPNMTIEGTINRTGWAQNAARDVDIPFQFSFLAKRITPHPIALPDTPTTNLPVIKWDKVDRHVTQTDINEKKRTLGIEDKLAHLKKVTSDPTSTTKDYASAYGALGTLSVADPSGYTGKGIGLTLDPIEGLRLSKKTDLENPNGTLSNISAGMSNLFGGITANLSGIRTALFKPVYGVLTALTKLVKKVTGSLSGVSGLFSGPLRDVLRDIRNVSNQAIGVVNLITNTVDSITNEINNTNRAIQDTVSLLKKTKGIITSLPETIDQSVKRLVAAGKMSNKKGFLFSNDYKSLRNGNRVGSKMALLSSGKRRTPQNAAKL